MARWGSVFDTLVVVMRVRSRVEYDFRKFFFEKHSTHLLCETFLHLGAARKKNAAMRLGFDTTKIEKVSIFVVSNFLSVNFTVYVLQKDSRSMGDGNVF